MKSGSKQDKLATIRQPDRKANHSQQQQHGSMSDSAGGSHHRQSDYKRGSGNSRNNADGSRPNDADIQRDR